jgi:hypothetical protein
MSYPEMPGYMPNLTEWLRKTVPIVNGIMQGRTNNYDTVTLTANAATTTVTLADGRLSSNCVILLMPTTAHASAEQGAGTIYIPTATIDVANNTFVIQHANNAQVDRTYRYIIQG